MKAYFLQRLFDIFIVIFFFVETHPVFKKRESFGDATLIIFLAFKVNLLLLLYTYELIYALFFL